MEGIQVTFNFKEGVTPTDIASKLRFHAGLLEGMSGSEAASRKNTDAPKKAVKTAPVDDDADVDSDDDDFDEPKKTVVTKNSASKKAASFDDDDDEVDASDEEEEAPKKSAKAKAKKVTLDDVNDACKARAAQTGGKEGRAEVLGILKKKFKTTSVSDLDADQYAAVIAAMA